MMDLRDLRNDVEDAKLTVIPGSWNPRHMNYATVAELCTDYGAGIGMRYVVCGCSRPKDRYCSGVVVVWVLAARYLSPGLNVGQASRRYKTNKPLRHPISVSFSDL
jgi:hypothetical protein